jgi:hypothetical protein
MRRTGSVRPGPRSVKRPATAQSGRFGDNRRGSSRQTVVPFRLPRSEVTGAGGLALAAPPHAATVKEIATRSAVVERIRG